MPSYLTHEEVRQIGASKVKFNLSDTANANKPESLEVFTRPLDVLNRVASLNASNMVTELVNDVNTRGQAATDNKISVSSALETVGSTLQSLVDDTL